MVSGTGWLKEHAGGGRRNVSELSQTGCALSPGPHCTPGGAAPSPRRGVEAGHVHGGLTPHRDVGHRRLAFVLALTAMVMVAEFVGGLAANSLALLADAAHMLTDVGALGLSLFALWFARRPATQEKTFGYLRLEILAALVNGAALIVLAVFIFLEAYGRFRSPEQVRPGLMIGVASAGLVLNVVAAFALHGSAGRSLNVRGAYLHVLGDLLGSLGAVVAAVVILLTGWTRADPLISVLVGLLILFSSWKLLRESVDVLLEAVPSHIELAAVQDAILGIPSVAEVHDLHVWTVTSGFLAMSGHAVVRDPDRHDAVLHEIYCRMHDRFGIDHVTVQLEQEATFIREPGG